MTGGLVLVDGDGRQPRADPDDELVDQALVRWPFLEVLEQLERWPVSVAVPGGVAVACLGHHDGVRPALGVLDDVELLVQLGQCLEQDLQDALFALDVSQDLELLLLVRRLLDARLLRCLGSLARCCC